MEWDSFEMNNQLKSNLKSLFEKPTEIQEKVLVYINAKVDLLIQAKTGEGKTLCYAIPIVNFILNFYERMEENVNKTISPVALILIPTRELGVQVKKHIQQIIIDKENNDKNKYLYNIKIADVLGGFAKPKQLKILNKLNPEIIIATPGRLWEIIQNEESNLLVNTLNKLKFLVIDECDRMAETGHFEELKNIIEFIYSRLEIKNNNKYFDEDNKRNNIKKEIMKFTGEEEKLIQENDLKENEMIAKKLNVDINNIETIDPISLINDNAKFNNEESYSEEQEEIENNKDINKTKKNINQEDIEMELEEQEEEEDEENIFDEEDEEINDKDEEDDEETDNNNNILNIQKLKQENKKVNEENIEFTNKVNLRTILCSATIDQIHKTEKKKMKNKNKKDQTSSEEKHFQNLIKNLKFYNKLIYLKLKSNDDLIPSLLDHKVNNNKLNELKENMNIEATYLPSKLEIDSYRCDSSTKDYYLYYLLNSNKDKKIIIFTNSISHTKKLYSIFSYFTEFKCTVLYSKMQQSNRIKNLDKFSIRNKNDQNSKNILFCTDIGARGLDIPLVDLVIHYHIPLKIETFIHRSGRTARANNKGKVSSLVSEKELNLYKKIMKDLKYNQFAIKTLPLGQLEKIKSLFEFAKNMEKQNFNNKKINKEKQWFEKNAKECELIYSDEDNEDNSDAENKKFLNKKRKLDNKEKFKNKKIYHKLLDNSIKRSSFITPDQVNKLNLLLKEDDTFKNINISQALYDAKNDQKKIKLKDKPKKRRYMFRRKGK